MTVKTLGTKWEFTIRITSGAPVVFASDGQVNPTKLVMTDYGDGRCKVTVFGQKANGFGAARSVPFNISGYQQHRPPPEWVLELLREHAFPQKEV